MSKRYFTIGMAGHIDHGKTTLTKALTNIDTDRLKEERNGKSPLNLDLRHCMKMMDYKYP